MAPYRFRKGKSGIATTFVSRKQALKRLQLSLKDFRRLCILKGIYPVEPPNKRKANKSSSTNKTYYYLKDIQFLCHEPLINKFRSFKIFVRRLRKAIGKKDQETSNRLRNNRPTFKLNHIVKERYPSFIDALRDLDDALSMCFLFSTFPKSLIVKSDLIQLCRRLTAEFLHYIMETRCLRKVFVSIKGIYYQAEIMGQLITWMVPHNLGYSMPTDVDFKIMVTFADFYSTMLGFVNFKLYHFMNVVYPPKLAVEKQLGENPIEREAETVEFVAALNVKLQFSSDKSAEEEVQLDEFPETEDSNEIIKEQKINEEKIKNLKQLFSECKIFLSREVPRDSLVFIIRSFGGEVSYDKTVCVGATFEESELSVTHQIVDRPGLEKKYLNRHYVQPQWVYDSVNAKMLLPLELYFPGEELPPHLSPFVEEKDGDYIPPEKQAWLDMQKGVTAGVRKSEETSDDELSNIIDSDGEIEKKADASEKQKNAKPIKHKLECDETESKRAKMEVTPAIPVKEDPSKLALKEAAEEKRLAVMMMPKKDKHLYDKIIFGQKRKNREIQKLKAKREEHDKKKTSKKKKNVKHDV